MDQNPPKESRPPNNLRIKFRSESLDQFIERYAVDMSRGGIFIRTRDPLAVGTQLKLDFQFQNGSPLMSGEGTVVWIRELDPNRTSVPPGMGVRFDKLTPESQTVLEQLLVEKAKRERSGVPGSGGQNAGGMAVRRPSSMFSVLEPQAPAKEGATANKTGGTTADKSAPHAPAGSPAAGGAPSAGPELGGKQDTPAYRPLGTARNPFSSVPASANDAAGTADTHAAPAGAATSGLKPLGGPSSVGGVGAGAAGNQARGTGAGQATVKPASPTAPHPSSPDDSAAPFDDMNDEPTQIAGRLPSFLRSDDDDEPTVAAKPLSEAVAAALRPPSAAGAAGKFPGSGGGAAAKKPAPGSTAEAATEPRRSLGAVGTTNPLPGSQPVSAKTSPEQAPPPALRPPGTADQPGTPRDTAQDAGAVGDSRGGSAADRATAPTPLAVPQPFGKAARTTGTGATAETPAHLAITQPAPVVAAAMASVAATGPQAPQKAGDPRTTTAAVVHPGKRRFPAAMVAGSVVVLGAAAFFLVRFLGDTSPRPVTPGAVPGSSATAVGPHDEPTTNPIAGKNEGKVGENAGENVAPPTGAATNSADPAAVSPPAGVPAVGASDRPAPVAGSAGPGGPAPEATDRPPVAVAKPSGKSSDAAKASKPKSASTKSKETREGATAGAAPVVAEAKPTEPPAVAVPSSPAAPAPAATPTPAAATAAKADSTASVTASDSAEADAHQIRVTSKPSGADVVLDGVTVGKTPYSVGIADMAAPHSIAVRKDGFEPFEQMISASSAWAKQKTAKGKPGLQMLKINARLKQIGGGEGGEGKAGAGTAGGEGEATPKTEPSKADRPLTPGVDDRNAADSLPP